MFVEITEVTNSTNARFSFQDLTTHETELLLEALVVYKNNQLPATEEFKTSRLSCIDMFLKIDQELQKSKS